VSQRAPRRREQLPQVDTIAWLVRAQSTARPAPMDQPKDRRSGFGGPDDGHLAAAPELDTFKARGRRYRARHGYSRTLAPANIVRATGWWTPRHTDAARPAERGDRTPLL